MKTKICSVKKIEENLRTKVIIRLLLGTITIPL